MSCISPRAGNFLLTFLHGLGDPSAWATCPLAGHSDLQFITSETDVAAVTDSRTRNLPSPSQEDLKGKSRVSYTIFHRLVQPSDPVMTKYGARDDPEDTAYAVPLD